MLASLQSDRVIVQVGEHASLLLLLALLALLALLTLLVDSLLLFPIDPSPLSISCFVSLSTLPHSLTQLNHCQPNWTINC
jgi:hypothetical protein